MSDQDTTKEPEDGNAAEEQQDSPNDDSSEEHSSDDEKDWDPDRARRTIAKIASEKKALRERVAAAEQKASSVDDLTKTNGDLSVANLRLEVGYELGLPLAIAKRLQGSNKEEMLADAETLVELVAPTKKPATRRPAEALRGGGAPTEEPDETDTRKLGARMFEH